jgi:glycosyltransferase involved in cell wall biosynthesis
MLLSIIIPAYNEALFIEQSIQRIRAAMDKLHIEWELIVCDNNSKDETAAIARKAGAKVVFEAQNQISRARNSGARVAKGEWLLFIDADTYPDANLMRDVINLIEPDTWLGFGSTVKAVDGPLWNRLRIERLNPSMRWFNWCGGAFIGCRKDTFEAIGGFSEDLYALEEIEFVQKLKAFGKKQGKRFKVLSNNPVYTSARRGQLTPGSIFRLFSSTLIAVIYLLLFYLLPKKLRPKANPKILSFWYAYRTNNQN